MTVEELKILVQEIVSHKCEKQHIEIKEANFGTPTRLYPTLSAFANQPGSRY